MYIRIKNKTNSLIYFYYIKVRKSGELFRHLGSYFRRFLQFENECYFFNWYATAKSIYF